ncbi:serine/threonine protein kinase [Ktedonobacteria bacterium brp13]|nr:serine/threonine protein kinase [Ktedonobacteria bacterium brp13]
MDWGYMDGSLDEVSGQSGWESKGYHILCSLDKGPSAEYLLAETDDHVQQVVIKLFALTLSEPQELQFFQQTARLQQLKDPHILRMLDAGSVENSVHADERQPFIVMAYTDRMTLRQRYITRSSRDIADFLPYLKTIGDALHYAHENMCAHRNLRPESILLHQDEELLLSDFLLDAVDTGVQEEIDETSGVDEIDRVVENYDHEMYGRVCYMAPEQFAGPGEYASDIYALGVMAYEWIAGEPPFHGSYAAIAEQHKEIPPQIPPPALASKEPPVADAVQLVIMRALAKDPAERFSSPGEFVAALEQALVLEVTLESDSEYRTDPEIELGSASEYRTDPEIDVELLRENESIREDDPVTPLPLSPLPRASHFTQPARFPDTSIETTPVLTPLTPQRVMPGRPAVIADSLHARRTSELSLGRRAFLFSLVALSALGGAAAWLFALRLTPSPVEATGQGLISDDTSGIPVSLQPTTMLTYYGHKARVNAVAWSPGDRLLATASDDHLVILLNANTGAPQRIYRGHTAEITTLAWSPNGRFIASAGADNAVHVWEAASGKVLRIYTGHTQRVNAVDWSMDSALVASASDDKTAQVWNVLNGEVAMVYAGHTDKVNSVAWSPDNTRIATGSWDHSTQVWATVPSDAFAIGDTVFSYCGHSAEVYGVAWSPDGRLVASAGGDNVVQICNGVNGAATTLPPRRHENIVYSVSWSPDGKQLATASADKTVRLWNAHTGRGTFIYRGHSDSVYAVQWSHNSRRLASASADRTARIWHP